MIQVDPNWSSVVVACRGVPPWRLADPNRFFESPILSGKSDTLPSEAMGHQGLQVN